MIIDSLQNAQNYFSIHPLFESAFDYLIKLKEKDFENEKVDLIRDKLTALFQRGEAKQNQYLEVHKKYLDIQYVFDGSDKIGWKDIHSCHSPLNVFDSENDFQLYSDKPSTYINLFPGEFIIFFPNDAHCPLAGNARYSKVVLKVLIDHK